jgi:hypothetical protein
MINTIDVLHDHLIGDSTFLLRKLEKINELTNNPSTTPRAPRVGLSKEIKNKRETAYLIFQVFIARVM